jgi:hypothetical protein
MFGPRERDEQQLKELMRVKKALDQCSSRTLDLLDKGITLMGMLPWADPERGLVVCHVDELIDLAWRPPEKVGRNPTPESSKMAVAVLRDLYPGPEKEKVRGAKGNLTKSREGNYAFNPYIHWLGEQLMMLDPKLGKYEACRQAWNATPAQSKRKSS